MVKLPGGWDTFAGMPEFDDDLHPRDEAGRFSGVGGSTEKRQQEALVKFAQAKAAAPVEKPKVEHKIAEASTKEFHAAFTAAFKGSDMAGYVTHYTSEQLQGMKLFSTADGKAGVAVHDHGDGRIEATALFSSGGGAGVALLRHAMENAGVNYVECYGRKLPELYATLGFKVATSDKFNPDYAAPSWNHEKHDSPNYFTMKLGG